MKMLCFSMFKLLFLLAVIIPSILIKYNKNNIFVDNNIKRISIIQFEDMVKKNGGCGGGEDCNNRNNCGHTSCADTTGECGDWHSHKSQATNTVCKPPGSNSCYTFYHEIQDNVTCTTYIYTTLEKCQYWWWENCNVFVNEVCVDY